MRFYNTCTHTACVTLSPITNLYAINISSFMASLQPHPNFTWIILFNNTISTIHQTTLDHGGFENRWITFPRIWHLSLLLLHEEQTLSPNWHVPLNGFVWIPACSPHCRPQVFVLTRQWGFIPLDMGLPITGFVLQTGASGRLWIVCTIIVGTNIVCTIIVYTIIVCTIIMCTIIVCTITRAYFTRQKLCSRYCYANWTCIAFVQDYVAVKKSI